MARISRTLFSIVALSSVLALGCEKKPDEQLEESTDMAAAPAAPTTPVAVAAAEGQPATIPAEQPAEGAEQAAEQAQPTEGQPVAAEPAQPAAH